MSNRLKTPVIIILALLLVTLLQAPAQAYLSTRPPPPNPTILWKKELSEPVRSIAWSPDSTRLAVGAGCCDHGLLIVLSSNGSRLWESDDLDGRVSSVSWSPDGGKIAVGVGSRVLVFSSNGTIYWKSDDLGEWVAVSWSPRGDILAVGVGWQDNSSYHGRVLVFDRYGRLIWKSKDLGAGVSSVSWSPDGRKLAVGTLWWDVHVRPHGRVLVFYNNSKLLWETEDLNNTVVDVSWSPRGDILAVACNFRRVFLLSSNGSIYWESKDLETPVHSVSWSPSGDKIAVGAGGAGVFIFDRYGRLIWESKDLGSHVYIMSVSWSPDGDKIALGNDNTTVVLQWVSFGTLKISSTVKSFINISGIGGQGRYIVEPGGSLTLYATPGLYNVSYVLPPPKYYYGSFNLLEGNLTVKVSPNNTTIVKIPSYDKFLARVNLTVPLGSTVVINSTNGKAWKLKPDNRTVTLWLSPGRYTITVLYQGASKTRKIEAKAGSIASIIYSKSDFQPVANVSGTVGNTTSSASNASIAQTIVINSTATMKKKEGLSSSTIIISIIIIIALTTITALTMKKKRKPLIEEAMTSPTIHKPTRQIREPGTADKTPPQNESKGLLWLESILGKPLKNHWSKPPCIGSYSINLPEKLAPSGYHGAWNCCKLGCGGWGCAYKCTREQDKNTVVFKVPRGFEDIVERGYPPTVDERLLIKVVNQANTISRIKHSHILRLLGYSEKMPLLLYEYAEYGSLDYQLSKGWRPTMEDTLQLALQVGDALRYIHSRGLVHGDVKTGNIFINGDGVVKLGDFSSLVRLVTMTSKHSLSYTPGWRAPEQVYSDLRLKAYNMGVENRIDVYQLGNLILYLLTGETIDGEEALKQDNVNEALEKVKDDDLRSLLREMLNPDPLQRPNIETILTKLYNIYKKSLKSKHKK